MTLLDLFAAIEQVESGGDPTVVGDDGKSIGPYQIQKPYWEDASIAGVYQSVRHWKYARKTMLCYWQRYCENALLTNDFQTLARVLNGGPSGMHYSSTLAYWKKVKKELNKIRRRKVTDKFKGAAKRALPCVFCFLLLGCAGYSLRLIHMPSTQTALESISTDSQDAADLAIQQYDRLYQELADTIPEKAKTQKDLVDSLADLNSERSEFMKTEKLLRRVDVMSKEVQKSLGMPKEPAGNVSNLAIGAGALGTGIAIGAAL